MENSSIRHLSLRLKRYLRRVRANGSKRKLFVISLLVIGVGFLVTHLVRVSALSNSFVQTDWSGGADTVTNINSSNLTGWTKYYSKTDGVDTSVTGEAKLNVSVSQP